MYLPNRKTRSYVKELKEIIGRGDLKTKAGDIRKMEWISIPFKMRRELIHIDGERDKPSYVQQSIGPMHDYCNLNVLYNIIQHHLQR